MNQSASMTPDFTVWGDGSVYVLAPQTDAARGFVEDHISPYEHMVFGGGVAVESRYIQDLCAGILEDGLTVEKDGARMYVGEDGVLYLRAQ